VSARGEELGFYPFADFSPELAAIRWARARGVPVHAIDLPMARPARGAGSAVAAAAAPPPPAHDLLAPLRRRVERAVLGGAGTLPGHALPELEREAAALAAHARPTAAEVLRDLAAAALDTGRDPAGARRPPDPTAFAGAWLRAALYEDAARRRLAIASW
jgi:hypothetical protein